MDKQLERVDLDDARYLALDNVPLSLVLTNPNLEDNPIIYVNRAFETVTGYSQASSVGRNCRFLQGENTSGETIQVIRDKMASVEECAVDILNYRADGSPFWNRLHITPLHDHQGSLRYFMGVQRLLGSQREARIAGGDDLPMREVTHRVKNHLSMIVSLIRLQSRAATLDPQRDYANLARRVEALQLLYQEMTDGGTGAARSERVALGAYVTRVVSAIGYLGGGSGIRTNVDVEFLESSLQTAAQIGLILSEVLTNAYQHAFDGRDHGLVDVRLKRLPAGTLRMQVSDDGNGMAEGAKWPEGGSLGGRIVRSLVSGLGARITVGRNATGTVVTVDIPFE